MTIDSEIPRSHPRKEAVEAVFRTLLGGTARSWKVALWLWPGPAGAPRWLVFVARDDGFRRSFVLEGFEQQAPDFIEERVREMLRPGPAPLPARAPSAASTLLDRVADLIASGGAVSDRAASKRILVIDDEEDVRLLLARIFGDAGYDVELADGAEIAVEKVEVTCPDLVVLDLLMPQIDGWWVLQRLRGMPSAPPVMILSALSDYSALASGVRAGVAAYVRKPFRIPELLATCEKVLSGGRGLARTEADRRGEPRRPLVAEVTVLSKDRSALLLGQLANLSPEGAQVRLGAPLEVGERVHLAFWTPGGDAPFTFEGQVLWRDAEPEGFSLGLAFVDLTPATQSELERLLVADPTAMQGPPA